MSRIELGEAIFMILVVLALWPRILGYEALWYSLCLVVLLVALGGILVRRVVAMNRGLGRIRKEQEAHEAGRPRPSLGGGEKPRK